MSEEIEMSEVLIKNKNSDMYGMYIRKANYTGVIGWEVDLDYLIEYADTEKEKKFYQSMKGKDIYEVEYRYKGDVYDSGGSYWFENKKLRDKFYNEEIAE